MIACRCQAKGALPRVLKPPRAALSPQMCESRARDLDSSSITGIPPAVRPLDQRRTSGGNGGVDGSNTGPLGISARPGVGHRGNPNRSRRPEFRTLPGLLARRDQCHVARRRPVSLFDADHVSHLGRGRRATRERRDQLTHPQYHKPELLASAPNQLWSWDITKYSKVESTGPEGFQRGVGCAQSLSDVAHPNSSPAECRTPFCSSASLRRPRRARWLRPGWQLVAVLMFDLALAIRRRQESANRSPADPNLLRDLPLGDPLPEEFLDLLKV